MELSCKSEYALLALLELARHYDQGEPIQIRQISAQQHIPDRYLEQLLAILRRAGYGQRAVLLTGQPTDRVRHLSTDTISTRHPTAVSNWAKS